MKPRRLQSATILSIVTTSVVCGGCSGIELGCYSRRPDEGLRRLVGSGAVPRGGARLLAGAVYASRGCRSFRQGHKETTLDISHKMCLHTLCSLADNRTEGTVFRPKGDDKSQERE